MAAKRSAPTTSLKEYLKKYESNADDERKKKKKKSKTKPVQASVLVVDEDPVWQKPVDVADDDDSADEEKPQIEEDIDVKRMKRLELIRARRPYNSISEDGSGWISLSDNPNNSSNADNNFDMSPPRKKNSRHDTPSVCGTEATDLSPPRQRKRFQSPSPELETKQNSDMSPPRKLNSHHATPSVYGTKATDLSPPRQRKRYQSPSPEPKNMQDSDLSSPRRSHFQTMPDKKKKSFENPNVSESSPPRRSRFSSSGLNLSPPRQRRKCDSPSSCYVDVQKNSEGIDISPPRRGKKNVGKHGSLEQSNSRSLTEDDVEHLSLVSDLSPPRKSRKEQSNLNERPKTGLLTGKDIKELNANTRKSEILSSKEMDPALSGRGAEPVYRDKVKGIRISKEEYLKSKKPEEKPKEKKLEWGKGLAQKREAESKVLELELEKDKPFARTRDDPELDKMLKERVRWGDPMAHLVKKSHSETLLRDLGDSDKMTESGFIIPQDVPNHSWIKRGLEAASNRYGIKPGRHWDGVDRSNGFEKGFFKRSNEKQATQKEAYLWSVADM